MGQGEEVDGRKIRFGGGRSQANKSDMETRMGAMEGRTDLKFALCERISSAGGEGGEGS